MNAHTLTKNKVPLYTLHTAADHARGLPKSDPEDWFELPAHLHGQPDMFVARFHGDTMDKRIPPGALCLFRFNPQGARNGKILLVQHPQIPTSEHDAHCVLKRYKTHKVFDGSGRAHTEVHLCPESRNPAHQVFIMSAEEADHMLVVAEFMGLV
ncbi:helix-turn-helix transcriptional regulator [Limnobacter sp.]|uniref:S24 family peptidase n=1 Tax=Limnobacter sp. TaxID=2003368 RepID=UPI0035181EB8